MNDGNSNMDTISNVRLTGYGFKAILDYKCKHSSQATVDIVQLLYKIKKTGRYDKKKLQKLLNYYAIEHDNMLVLRR